MNVSASNLYVKVNIANQNIIYDKHNEDYFTETIQEIFKNKESLLYNDDLLLGWKDLSCNIARHLDLPAKCEVARSIKEINSYISEQSFFPDTACNTCEDIFKPILSHMGISNNYLYAFSSRLKAAACVSKKWNFCVNEMQIGYELEHNYLKENTLILETRFKRAEEAVDSIIKNRLPIACFTGLPDLTEGLLEKLFERSPYVKHLLIQSDNIMDLPVQCSQLETLCIMSSSQLKSLPDMPNLTHFTCSQCPGLAKMPKMPKLKSLFLKELPNIEEQLGDLFKDSLRINHLHIQSNTITHLPVQCSQLKKLVCEDCLALKSLPDMPKLTYLKCNRCISIIDLPHMPQLTSLFCQGSSYRGMSIEKLPKMPKLKSLDCSYCPKLGSLTNMPKLTNLACKGLKVASIEQFIEEGIFSQLESLDCSYSYKITHLFPMPQLKSLICNQCWELNSLPAVPKLTNLACNSSTKLANLADMPKLNSLDCGGMAFTKLEEFINLDTLRQLAQLSCCNCKNLSHLPDMPNLTSFDCSLCDKLTDLPKLPKLTSLKCSNCPLLNIEPKSLPETCDIIDKGIF